MEMPILYLIFNRHFETKQSFEILKNIKPRKLYIAADGPRDAVAGEVAICKEVRDYVLSNIDWDCEVKSLFRDTNHGCGAAVQGALDWFFNQEEMGIILEDDIIPDVSFFQYAETLLQRYKDDKKIFSINGCNLGYINKGASYGLTRYFNMWGWATWRRTNNLVKETWATIDLNKDFQQNSSILNSLKLNTIWPLEEWYLLWRGHFKRTLSGKIDTWDYQWSYTSLKNGMFCIRPNVNLVNNIGFNENATHTVQMDGFNDKELKASTIFIDDSNIISPALDDMYERKFIAEKWQHLPINHNLLLKKIRKKIRKKISKLSK